MIISCLPVVYIILAGYHVTKLLSFYLHFLQKCKIFNITTIVWNIKKKKKKKQKKRKTNNYQNRYDRTDRKLLLWWYIITSKRTYIFFYSLIEHIKISFIWVKFEMLLYKNAGIVINDGVQRRWCMILNWTKNKIKGCRKVISTILYAYRACSKTWQSCWCTNERAATWAKRAITFSSHPLIQLQR